MSKEYTGSIGAESWTASDSVTFPKPARGFQVGVAGDVAIEYADGSTVVLPGCAAGVVHAHNAVKILSTGTTATTLVVIY